MIDGMQQQIDTIGQEIVSTEQIEQMMVRLIE
jgi:hypothetical protein